MNERRKENGLEPLARNQTLDAAARYKSWDMAQRDYFAHIGPNGTKVGVKFIKRHIRCNSIGENLHRAGYGESVAYPGSELPRDSKIATDAVDALLNSPGHRANALSPNYDSQGIGVFVDENGTVFVTQEFCG
ncbi:cysteine-rich secretory protein family protein [Halolamina pelagica]|uniref:Cysteine-rich secretory protein family protein n=2 Tax=Halolamina pelagica TaxID=699431 RepID=A0A0N8I045_9EURY|nr:cysteine-rich secretory protein family protein [Halolamina pelagica]